MYRVDFLKSLLANTISIKQTKYRQRLKDIFYLHIILLVYRDSWKGEYQGSTSQASHFLWTVCLLYGLRIQKPRR